MLEMINYFTSCVLSWYFLVPTAFILFVSVLNYLARVQDEQLVLEAFLNIDSIDLMIKNINNAKRLLRKKNIRLYGVERSFERVKQKIVTFANEFDNGNNHYASALQTIKKDEILELMIESDFKTILEIQTACCGISSKYIKALH